MSRSDIAISVRGVSKSFTISHGQEKHTTLAEKCMARLRNPLHRPRTETFQALEDINFDIKKGDVVGIIGRNGAGKSTLLKILSRITEPTSGEIRLYGRVGSLLEVGTGFHPELTGRENIFLNGAILGMSKAEIRKQFDAIVDFSEIEKFLDTPVKRYSSGMYVRLAFAVAAHLNPEILIVDEVLSVGDAEFQKKCLGKMQEVSDGQGRTVLFVSHNMAAVQNLCHHCILLKDGQVLRTGTTAQVVAAYILMASSIASVFVGDRTDRTGTGQVRCTNLKLLDAFGATARSIRTSEPFAIEVEVSNLAPVDEVTASIDVDTLEGTRITTLFSGFIGQTLQLKPGRNILRCYCPGLNLRPDNYSLNVMLAASHGQCDFVQGAMLVAVEQADILRSGRLPDRVHGPMMSPFRWSSETPSESDDAVPSAQPARQAGRM